MQARPGPLRPVDRRGSHRRAPPPALLLPLLLTAALLATACDAPGSPDITRDAAAPAAADSTATVTSALQDRSETPETPSFSRHIQPVLNVTCVSCHLHGNAIGDLDLGPEAAYASLVGVASTQADMLRVEPGAPQDSYLLHKLHGTHSGVGGNGERMPPHTTPLSPRQLELVSRWIERGAPR